MAKARVRIKDGKIEALSDPSISFCPLRRDLYGIEHESRKSVERVLRSHMDEMGMYGPSRVLELKDQPISFGASEILADGMNEGLVDAAVLVCEGAGSVIATRPDVLQAIGAHMIGLIQTEPISEIQKGLEARGTILLDRRASIDQTQAFEKAAVGGFKKIAVTLAGIHAGDAQSLRARGVELGVEPIILAVHTSGISETQAEALDAKLRSDLVLRLKGGTRGGGKGGAPPDGHIHPGLSPDPGGKAAAPEPGVAFLRALGHAQGRPTTCPGKEVAQAADLRYLDSLHPWAITP
jgi:putative methanogenesis marker protein 8